jgi:hypothetical protein
VRDVHAGVRAQEGNPSHWLRLGGERRGEETAGEGADECPPIHYSIT